MNASVLKVKLAMAIIGISSIHLLKTFIEAGQLGLPVCDAAALGARIACSKATTASVMWQTIIHCVFILSAIGIALTDRVMMNAGGKRLQAAH